MAPSSASKSISSKTGTLGSADVLNDFQVSDAGSIYLLGCLEKRVTLYSQQVRAINLVTALLDEGRISRESRVAIVGGGAAGLTAAAAIALALPDIKALDVYERQPELLHLQMKSPHRYLHPHIYDWPHSESLLQDAGLPVLNWSAGPAGDVAKQILDAFDQISARVPQMQLRTEHTVQRVDEFDLGLGCRLRVANHPSTGYTYDLALLSIGFGIEKATDNEKNHPYWDAHLMVGPLRGAGDTHKIFVSGNGDGGLVDFIIAAFNGRSHDEIFDLITSRNDLDEVKRVLLEIEAEAWKLGSALDMDDAYERRLLPVVPPALLRDILSALRRNAEVWFHTPHAQLFRPNTAVLNRFIAFLALQADRKAENYKLRVVKGYEISNEPLDECLRLTDGSSITPTRRYLRFGADTKGHHAPFLKQIEAFQSRHPALPAAYRPATPPLTASAITRFSRFATASSVPRTADAAAPEDSATGPPGLTVRLSKTHDGNVVWSSDVSSSDVRRVWADHASEIVLRCEMTPDEAGPLRFAVARLIAHARAYRLYCHNSHAWTRFLREFYGERRPGPGVDFQFRARLCGDEIPEGTGGELVGMHELASRIHLSLDHDVLDRLNLMVERCLHPTAPASMGWPLEAGLRTAMAHRWREWYAKLLESDAKRRRFLILLVSPDDDTDLGPAGLVRVGPKCVEPHLLRATLLVLAFSLSTEPSVTPSASFPGNFGGPALSAHALGVTWLDGVDVGPEVASRQWPSDVVLLSELREPPLYAPNPPRLDHADDSIPGMQDVPAHEQPLILGCTSVVRSAFRIGEVAVRDHFTSVLRRRARSAARMLG